MKSGCIKAKKQYLGYNQPHEQGRFKLTQFITYL